MALDRSQRVSRDAALPDGVDLTPQDYFVLSRVAEPMSVGDLILSSGLPSADATRIVERLVEVGALRVSSGQGPGRSRSASSPSRSNRLRAQAEERRRKALASALRGGPPSSGPASPGTPPAKTPTSALRAEPPPPPEPEPDDEAGDESGLERVERKRVPRSDSRLGSDYAIDEL